MVEVGHKHTVSTSIGSIFLRFCNWSVTFGSKTLPMKPYTWEKSGRTANKGTVWVIKTVRKWNTKLKTSIKRETHQGSLCQKKKKGLKRKG